MATAKKLPSGSWRCRVFSHVDENGKKIYKSFTCDDPSKAGKRKCEAEASAWAMKRKEERRKFDSAIPVEQAIERYINAKTGTLSASTIRGYRQLQSKYYGAIEKTDIYQLTTESLQRYVSSLVGTVSAKTISNCYGLLSASIKMFRPDAVFRVTLPKRVRPKKASPSNAHVQTLFLSADDELKLAIALAAFGGLRRGEVCALKHGDVVGNHVYVHADMVENENNKFEYKEIPKTEESVRMVRLPDEVIAMIGSGGQDEFIVNFPTPNALTHRFIRLRNRLGFSEINYHDLRHYFASIGAVLGVPDGFLASFGGWRPGSSVMKEVYQNVIEDEKTAYQDKMVEHFSKLMKDV